MQGRTGHPWTQRGSKSRKDGHRRDVKQQPIVCLCLWNLHWGTVGKAEGSVPMGLPMGHGGDKAKGQPLYGDGVALYIDHGSGCPGENYIELHIQTHTSACKNWRKPHRVYSLVQTMPKSV